MFSSTDLAVEHDYSKNQIVAKKKLFCRWPKYSYLSIKLKQVTTLSENFKVFKNPRMTQDSSRYFF